MQIKSTSKVIYNSILLFFSLLLSTITRHSKVWAIFKIIVIFEGQELSKE